MRLRQATPGDVPLIESLLTGNDLPTVGVREAIGGFLVALEGAVVVGAVGIEPCGPAYGLLRSAVVSDKWRGKGIGRELVKRAISDARGRGVQALYLLTTTAEDYFPLFGFGRTSRDSVPDPVRATDEFRSACPESATVMTLEL
jgi:N-acetylglutamate synthase-like GNAT family acetyltransferase